MKAIRQFLRSEDGIAVTEYGLLIALVAIALIAVVTVFGNDISSWFQKKTGQITTVEKGRVRETRATLVVWEGSSSALRARSQALADCPMAYKQWFGSPNSPGGRSS